MNIRRKGAGIAFTATLLSALVATVAAPLASASVSVTSAGAVPRGGTSSGTASFTFTENSGTCFTNAVQPTALVVTILDSASAATVSFSGTPTVTGPGSIGATASVSGNTLTVAFAGATPLGSPEVVTVSGLKISATTAAASGAIQANLTGTESGCVLPGTATATGTLANDTSDGTPGTYEVGKTSFNINVTSACPFSNQGTDPNASALAFATNPESLTTNAASAVVAGQQTVGTAAGNANPHNVGEAVSQTVSNCSSAIGSPGSVANAVNQTAGTPTVVVPGQTNQATANTTVAEYPLGDQVTLSGTITFTITTAGVVFSGSPTANPTSDISLGALLPVGPPSGLGTPVACNVSADRKSCSVTVTANNGTAGTLCTGGMTASCGNVTLQNITVDVDSTATLGAAVVITATTTPALNVTSNVVANIGRLIVASAAQPVVFIGQNNQASGTIVLKESNAGFFTAGPGPLNFIVLCYFSGETFTSAPWAIVTVGDLKLLSGSVGVASIRGTLINISGNACAYWQVYSASTAASTIEIRGADATGAILPAGDNNGPRLNISPAAVPGSSQAALFVGPFVPTTPTGFQLFSNAIRAFGNSVSVTASSQPRCDRGSTDCLAGNIVVTETSNGQFRAGEVITVNILPRATTQRMDVLLQTSSTNQTPIVTTNASESGLLVTPVGVTCTPSAIFGVVVCNFAITVTQQAFGPALGKMTFSNIHYVVAADAVFGNVNVNVTGMGGGAQTLDAVVTNAIIGAAPVATSIDSAVGVGIDQGATFGTRTALPNSAASGADRYATWRFHMDPSMAGEWVDVYWATKTNGTWSAFTFVKRVKVNGSGDAYFHWKAANGSWIAAYGKFAGNASHAAAQSRSRQARYLDQ